jgi:hypothetical protein
MDILINIQVIGCAVSHVKRWNVWAFVDPAINTDLEVYDIESSITSHCSKHTTVCDRHSINRYLLQLDNSNSAARVLPVPYQLTHTYLAHSHV